MCPCELDEAIMDALFCEFCGRDGAVDPVYVLEDGEIIAIACRACVLTDVEGVSIQELNDPNAGETPAEYDEPPPPLGVRPCELPLVARKMWA